MSLLTIIGIAVVIIIVLKTIGFLIKNIAIIAITIVILVGGYVLYNNYQHDLKSLTIKDATKATLKVAKSAIK